MGFEFVTAGEKKYFFTGKPLPKIYIEYLTYLRESRELAPGSIQNRKAHVLTLLEHFSKHNSASNIHRIKPKDVQDYTMDKALPLTRNMKRSLVIALRDFFRFLHFSGYTKTDLSISVPTITTYRMSAIPKGMPWDVVKKLLKVPNRKTLCGKRDYAIILIFARYGIRACQLRELKLQDIDWKGKSIRFAAKKGGKEVLAPLFDDIAKAIIAYFKAGRMKAPKKYNQVFLTSGTHGSSTTGQRPLRQSTWNIVNLHLNKIAVDKSFRFKRGPHSIRHAYATELLDNNEPIKNIADLLGHKSLHTTYIYTKSSIKNLRPLGREWPERKHKGVK